jgi:hypothetical protein
VTEHAAHQFGVADLRRMAAQRGGHLRVEQRCERSDHRRQHLEVLTAGVQDFQRPRGAERRD